MSDERRAAMAKAISEALPSYMQVRGLLDPTGKPPYWGPDGEGLQPIVDAAIGALGRDDAERHDAPGVGMSREDAEQLVDDYCGLEAQRRHLIALLTGQPDAPIFEYDAWREQVRQTRMKHRVHMKEMADLLGISSAQYSSIETGELIPSPEFQRQIEQRLGITGQPGAGRDPDAADAGGE